MSSTHSADCTNGQEHAERFSYFKRAAYDPERANSAGNQAAGS